MVIVLDIDGVLANFTKAYGELLTKVGGDKLPAGWQDDPDFPAVWYWERAAGYSKEVEERVWSKYITQKGSHFWKNLEPLPTARESLMHLNSLIKQGHTECYFLTHRMGHGAKLQTEEWLYANGIDYPTVLMTGEKVPWLRLLKANFFIDDRPETIQDVARVAVEEKWPDFKLYLKQAPYNTALWGKVGSAAVVKDALVAAGVLA